MSIVTLKRKTQTQYNNMSVNSKHGFSLNGTRRSQGYVGQTSLSRSLPRTLMRGGVARGHGGSDGTFHKYPIITSAVTSLNDPKIVKPSTINTLGMLEERNQYLLNHQTVKPDINQNINTHENHVKNLATKTIQCANALQATNKDLNKDACKKCYNYNTFFRQKTRIFTKPASNYGAITEGEYLLQLKDKCQKLDLKYVPVSYKRGALPGPGVSY
jgi:hypothetical protein